MGGACFMQRASSFFIKLGTFCDLGLRRKCLDDKGTKFPCNMYSRVSAMRVSDESDYSTSNSESGTEGEGSFLRESSWEFERVELFCAAVRVVKSLNWRVATNLCFAKAVERYGFDMSSAAYAMFVNAYADAQMEKEVFSLIRDIVSYYQKTGLDLFNIMFLLLEQPGDAKRSSFVVNALIKVFASNRIFDNAVDVFVQSKGTGIELDIRCCNFLLKCLQENNERGALFSVFDEMKRFGPFPSVYTYTIVMKFYCNVEMDEATALLEEMVAKGISPSVVTNNTYISGLCRFGKVDRAWRFLHDSQPLNCYCYNSVIHGFINKGELGNAIHVFDELKSSAIDPDVYSYSILIEGFCIHGNFEKSLELYEEMQNRSLKPSLVTYTSIVKCLCNNGLMEESLKTFREIGKSGVEYDQHIYDVLITGFCKQGDVDKADALVEEMLAKKLSPSSSYCKSLILGFSKIGSSEKALTLFDLMTRSRGVVACNNVIDGFCKERRFEEALQFMNEMRRKGIISPNIFTYGLVIDGMCKARETERALEIIPSMLKCGVSPNVVVFSCIIDGFCKQGEAKKALNLFEKMLKFGVEPDVIALAILINVFYRGKMSGEANKVLEAMVSEGRNPDEFCYAPVIAGFGREKDMGMALEKYREMLRRGISPSVVTCTCLIGGFFNVKRADAAWKFYLEMCEKMISLDTLAYAVLIRGFQSLGYAERAKEICIEMQEYICSF